MVRRIAVPEDRRGSSARRNPPRPRVRQCVEKLIDDFRRGVLRPLQGRRVGVRNGKRMERRVHIAWIEGQERNAVRLRLLGPDCRQVAERRLARPVSAPPGIGIDRRVA